MNGSVPFIPPPEHSILLHDAQVHHAAVLFPGRLHRMPEQAAAERLERPVDAKYLRRDHGFYRLDVKREWRIGATAMRILALAEANGSRFREWSGRIKR